jgi:putative transposase
LDTQLRHRGARRPQSRTRHDVMGHTPHVAVWIGSEVPLEPTLTPLGVIGHPVLSVLANTVRQMGGKSSLRDRGSCWRPTGSPWMPAPSRKQCCGRIAMRHEWLTTGQSRGCSRRGTSEPPGLLRRCGGGAYSLAIVVAARTAQRVEQGQARCPRYSSWWAENSKEAYNTGLANAAVAFSNYVQSRRHERRGRSVGRPRHKRKHRTKMSCRFTTGVIRVEPDRRHVTLPVIGTIRTHESTRKLAHRLERGVARVLSATIRFERGRWFCSFQVEVQREPAHPVQPTAVVGIDLGISKLAVLSQPILGVTDQAGIVANPRHLDRALRQLRCANRRISRRQGPDRRSGQTPSARWLKANRRRNQLCHRVSNLRTDGLNKLTTVLASQFGTIVVEDLNVAGMIRNRRLARRIVDASFGSIRRQLEYKTRWLGGRLHVASRWYPSSKTCSACGTVKAKLPLHVRIFCCSACGLVLDRDLNAARNLAAQFRDSRPRRVAPGRKKKPDGNSDKTSARTGAGIATGRPVTDGSTSSPQGDVYLDRIG